MTVIRELYGLVNFPGGRFIAQVYRCSSSRLHTVIRVPWDTGTRPGASDGKSGMQLGETLGGYSIVKQKHLQKKKKLDCCSCQNLEQ